MAITLEDARKIRKMNDLEAKIDNKVSAVNAQFDEVLSDLNKMETALAGDAASLQLVSDKRASIIAGLQGKFPA